MTSNQVQTVKNINPEVSALLIPGTALPSVAATQYTASRATVVEWYEFNNTDVVQRTVTVNAIPAGGAAGVATQIMKVPLAPGEHAPIQSAEVILAGYQMQLTADAAGVVRASVSGKVLSL